MLSNQKACMVLQKTTWSMVLNGICRYKKTAMGLYIELVSIVRHQKKRQPPWREPATHINKKNRVLWSHLNKKKSSARLLLNKKKQFAVQWLATKKTAFLF